MNKRLRRLSTLALAVFTACVFYAALLMGCASASVVKGDNSAPVDANGKSIIIYFTYSENIGDTSKMSVDAITAASLHSPTENTIGNLRLMVDEIKERTAADIYSIRVANPYAPEFDDMRDVAKMQIQKGELIELKEELPDLSKYETVYFGSPIWWYTVPAPVSTFLKKTDMTGKTVIPFGIHRGSGINAFLEALKEFQPKAVVGDSFTVNATMANADVKNSFNQFLDSILNKAE